MKLYRIINIKKSTNIYNVIIINSNGEKFKTVISKQEYENLNLQLGSSFLCELEESHNKFTGDAVYVLNNINKVNNSTDCNKNSYNQIKYFNKKMLNDNFVSSIMGESNIKNWHFRVELLDEIRKKMASLGYIEYYSPTLLDTRGTSMVSPLLTKTKYQGDKYLKITNELLLKKVVFITLKSLFEIGYLSRDVNDGKDSLLNYLSLEAVGTQEIELKLQDFYEFVFLKTIELCKEYGIKIKDGIDNLKICDVLSIYLCTHKIFDKAEFINYYRELKKQNITGNIIYLNAPIDSPLVMSSEFDIPMEIKWYINSSSVGHGYKGQTNADILYNEFKKQQEMLASKNIISEIDVEFIKLVKYVGLDTFSFNLGIDRYLYNIFDFDNAKASSRVLGI